VGAQYVRIVARIRDGVAVAEARNGACMACFMALRPQVMAEVRRGEEIITCDNCNRILYYAPKDSAPASSSSAQPKMAHT
jgi:predicted  nucleic acid-binding Zn-ribbon protein